MLFHLGLETIGYMIFGLVGAFLVFQLPGKNVSSVVTELSKEDQVIYGQDEDGNEFPIAVIRKHENCPDKVYEAFWEEMLEEE